MNPSILVSLFNQTTAAEFLKSDRSHLGSVHKIHEFKKGDIVLLLDIQSKRLFGITLLDSYASGKVYQDHHLLDIDIYSGDKQQYNKYDVKIQNFREINIPFEDLAILCGKTINDKTYNNIWRGTQTNFRYASYKGEDSKDVLLRLRLLIKSLMSVV